MAFKPCFDLDAAVSNAMARVEFHIRNQAEIHENALANHAVVMRAAWRNRHLVLLRELCGVTFPTRNITATDVLRVLPLRRNLHLVSKD